MDIDPLIKKVEGRPEWPSVKETQEIYEDRENARIDLNNKIYSAMEEGRGEAKKKIARNLLQSRMDIAQVAEITELPIEEVKKLVK
jgi:predicted transposase/invertase (TIGR01784 family)